MYICMFILHNINLTILHDIDLNLPLFFFFNGKGYSQTKIR
jgi:hypothetical protein